MNGPEVTLPPSAGWMGGCGCIWGRRPWRRGKPWPGRPRASGCAAAGPTTLVTRCPTTGRRWNRSGRRRNAGAESDPGCSGLRPGGGGDGGAGRLPGPAGQAVWLPGGSGGCGDRREPDRGILQLSGRGLRYRGRRTAGAVWQAAGGGDLRGDPGTAGRGL